MATTVGGSIPQFVADVTLTPSPVSASSVSVETLTVTGLQPEFIILVNVHNLEAGLFLLHSECTASNVLQVTLWNTTGATVTPAAQVLKIIGF